MGNAQSGSFTMQMCYRTWWRFTVSMWTGSASMSLGVGIDLWPYFSLRLEVCGLRFGLTFDHKKKAA